MDSLRDQVNANLYNQMYYQAYAQIKEQVRYKVNVNVRLQVWYQGSSPMIHPVLGQVKELGHE